MVYKYSFRVWKTKFIRIRLHKEAFFVRDPPESPKDRGVKMALLANYDIKYGANMSNIMMLFSFTT